MFQRPSVDITSASNSATGVLAVPSVQGTNSFKEHVTRHRTLPTEEVGLRARRIGSPPESAGVR